MPVQQALFPGARTLRTRFWAKSTVRLVRPAENDREPASPARKGAPYGESLLRTLIGPVLALSLVVGCTGHDTSAPDAAPTGPATDVTTALAATRLPPGYQVIEHMDLVRGHELKIAYPPRQRRFMIMLQGSEGPASGDVAALRTRMLDAMSSRNGCKFVDQPDDVVTVHGKALHFNVRTCTDSSGTELVVETGWFAARVPRVDLTAYGTASGFDRDALHAILASVK